MPALEKLLHDDPEPTPILAKAALAHVQSETIHPFLGGNGPVGRLLIEPGEGAVPQRLVVNLDSVESVSFGVLVQRMGRLADVRMREICGALAIAVGCQD
jgi:mRNA-degrading endonuclease toxin of MazEF toxin-antitoxin module